MRRQNGPSNQHWRRIFLLGHSFLSAAGVYVRQTRENDLPLPPFRNALTCSDWNYSAAALRQLCAVIGRRIQGVRHMEPSFTARPNASKEC
jgi:hypothetical protein